MNLQTIISEEKQTALIVSHTKHPLVPEIRSALERYGVQVFFSPHIPPSLTRYDICFFVNEDGHFKKSTDTKHKIIYLFINKDVPYRYTTISNTKDSYPKVIKINGEIVKKEDVERVLWFSLSGSRENFLVMSLSKAHKLRSHPHTNPRPFVFPIRITAKRIFGVVFMFFLIIHLLYLFPLLASTFFSYKAGQALVHEQMSESMILTNRSRFILSFARTLYRPVRPTYLFFSLAIIPDGVFDMNEKTYTVVDKTAEIMNDMQTISSLILKRDKSNEEVLIVKKKLDNVQSQLVDLEDAISLLNQKIPSSLSVTKKAKGQLSEAADSLSKARKIIPLLVKVLASPTDQKYLLLFANNMELRPGGGFIGSFAILHLSNYTMGNLEVYDVYDADGQLTAHVEPPDAIEKYLNQPHFFLRDSAFYPDFVSGYTQAVSFLEKEMNLTNFAGGALFTTTSVEQLLKAFGEIYLPDYDEKVDSKNFYLKAQIYSEKDFFPGSLQKKNFLASLMRQLFISLDTVSPRILASEFKKAADEKQIVFFFNDPALEEEMNNLYWSGRVIEPRCSAQVENCIVDYMFPYDANLGVNKANFFVTRSLDLKITIDQKGQIRHTLTAVYKNDSPGEVFPGGTYKNYFQLMIPQDTIIDEITKNGVSVEEYDTYERQYNTVGFLLEVPPRRTVEVKIAYHTDHPFQNGRGILQLITQKQIGAKNGDFRLTLELPSNMYLLNQNFTPLVKGNSIVYNTVLSTDKIFFIELTKE